MLHFDIGDRILAQLEDSGIDQRIGHEVVATPPKQLLDRNRQVGMGNIEKRMWVVDTLSW
jgi:hypothetical protein